MEMLYKKILVYGMAAVLCCAWLNVAQAAPMQLGVSTGTAQQGSPFTVDVAINNANDLFAFQFDLAFDPILLRATNVSEGTFLPGAGATFPVLGLIDNIGGMITGISDALVGFVPGATGNGVLFTISFDALASGISELTITNPLFLNSTLADITDLSVNDGTVTIMAGGGPSPVPEPASWTLVVAGLAVIAGMRRRRTLKGIQRRCLG